MEVDVKMRKPNMVLVWENGDPVKQLATEDDFVMEGQTINRSFYVKNIGDVSAFGVKISCDVPWVAIKQHGNIIKPNEKIKVECRIQVPTNLTSSPKPTFIIEYAYILQG